MHQNSAQNSFGKLLDKKTVAAMLGISTRQVDYLRMNENLPWFQVGHRVRFSEHKINQWLASKEQNGVQK